MCLTGSATMPSNLGKRYDVDWTGTDPNSASYIINKPLVSAFNQIPADWNVTTGVAVILNKPTIAGAGPAGPQGLTQGIQGLTGPNRPCRAVGTVRSQLHYCVGVDSLRWCRQPCLVSQETTTTVHCISYYCPAGRDVAWLCSPVIRCFRNIADIIPKVPVSTLSIKQHLVYMCVTSRHNWCYHLVFHQH